MPISRYERKLNHIKSLKVRVASSIPNNREGSDGEMVLVVNHAGMKLYIKYGAHGFLIIDNLKRDFQGSTYNDAERSDTSTSNRHSKINALGAFEANQDILLSQIGYPEVSGTSFSIKPKTGKGQESFIKLEILYVGLSNETLRLKNGHMQFARGAEGDADNLFLSLNNVRNSGGDNDTSKFVLLPLKEIFNGETV